MTTRIKNPHRAVVIRRSAGATLVGALLSGSLLFAAPASAIPDSDSDGLTDTLEIGTYNTNPNVKDTDGDGLSDGVEVYDGLNPLVANAPAAPAAPAAKVAPTNAVSMITRRSGLQVNVTVTNTSDLAAQCTYDATEANGLGLPVHRDFNLAARGSTTLTFPAPLPGQGYNLVAACAANFEGQNVEIGRITGAAAGLGVG